MPRVRSVEKRLDHVGEALEIRRYHTLLVEARGSKLINRRPVSSAAKDWERTARRLLKKTKLRKVLQHSRMPYGGRGVRGPGRG